QAQILDLMRKLRDETNTAILLITHDMGIIAEMCDSVAVMFFFNIAAYTEIYTIFDHPLHPYTEGLLAAIPVLGEVTDYLAVIPGSVPNLIELPPACKFAARWPYRKELCVQREPQLLEVATGHQVRCFMRDPQTAHLWAGVERTDWRFQGEELFVEPVAQD
ncbi:MAG: ABC transporter ATP-binding protein, partial [Caldilineaceae bacterium]|nr:ABC transporter ATP-binding protein [Caldilineaceae bacterium]